MSAAHADEATLGDALAASRDEKLQKLAFEAWQKWSASNAGAERRDYVASGLKLDRTYSLIEQFQPQVMTQAIGWLLNREKQRIVDEGKRNQNTGVKLVGGGQIGSDTHDRNAPATPPRDAAPSQTGQRSEPATATATPKREAPAAPPTPDDAKRARLKILSDKQEARARSMVKTMIQLSKLDTVMVFGKKIGNCTVAEVRDWITAREQERRDAGRDVLFARNLIANLPPYAVVREHWPSADAVDMMYVSAEADNAK